MNIENLYNNFFFNCVISIFEIFEIICVNNTEWINFDYIYLSLLNSRIVKVLRINLKNYWIEFYVCSSNPNLLLLNKKKKRKKGFGQKY